MEIYNGNLIDFTLLDEIISNLTDDELIIMNLGSTLNVKLAIYEEYSNRNYFDFYSLNDMELLDKCSSDMQLERSLALRIASMREVV